MAATVKFGGEETEVAGFHVDYGLGDDQTRLAIYEHMNNELNLKVNVTIDITDFATKVSYLKKLLRPKSFRSLRNKRGSYIIRQINRELRKAKQQ